MNKAEIMTVLPHRDNMLLIDEAELIDGYAHGKKRITGDEWFLDGHFQDNPVVPGVILCEIMAQSVCVAMKDELRKNSLPYFTGLDKVKFKNPVRPGDLFETECKITKARPPFYFATGKGYVDGKLSVSAEFSFAIVDKG
ncbi:MAG: 3-hydroxyacyl-ACP dehydratase FabZ family protein [Monoglobales bacterium]